MGELATTSIGSSNLLSPTSPLSVPPAAGPLYGLSSASYGANRSLLFLLPSGLHALVSMPPVPVDSVAKFPSPVPSGASPGSLAGVGTSGTCDDGGANRGPKVKLVHMTPEIDCRDRSLCLLQQEARNLQKRWILRGTVLPRSAAFPRSASAHDPVVQSIDPTQKCLLRRCSNICTGLIYKGQTTNLPADPCSLQVLLICSIPNSSVGSHQSKLTLSLLYILASILFVFFLQLFDLSVFLIQLVMFADFRCSAFSPFSQAFCTYFSSFSNCSCCFLMFPSLCAILSCTLVHFVCSFCVRSPSD